MDLSRIGQIAGAECERQQVGMEEFMDLLTAYRYVDRYGIKSEGCYRVVASIIEPIKNARGYRTWPVIFQDGGGSANVNEIPRLMINFRDNIIALRLDNGTFPPGHVDAMVKQFLSIHPFVDGNGRLAWILYNYLFDTLDYPSPLPNYFGDS